jgi:hypothetical protein
MQRKYGSLSWMSADSGEQDKLNTEFEKVLGMRPLAPSHIPLFGFMYRKKAGSKRMQFIFSVIDNAYRRRKTDYR